jgi:hypothetical protein
MNNEQVLRTVQLFARWRLFYDEVLLGPPHVNIRNLRHSDDSTYTAAAVCSKLHHLKDTLGIHKWTQTGKGTYIWALCQKNEGSVEIKQETN